MSRLRYFFAFILLFISFLIFGFIVLSRADAATVCPIFLGCTGTSTSPSYGKLLIGGKNGEYEFVASSTLSGGGSSSASSTLLRDSNTFSGTTTLATTSSYLLDLGGAVYNAKAFGIVGDGVTDDRLKFQALIALASSTKGTIYVPLSRIYISTPTSQTPSGYGYSYCGLVVDSNVKIVGVGRKSSIFTTGPIPSRSGDPREGYFSMFCNSNGSGQYENISIESIGVVLPTPNFVAGGLNYYDSAFDFFGVSSSTVQNTWVLNGSLAFRSNTTYNGTSNALTKGGNHDNIAQNNVFENVPGSLGLINGTNNKFQNNYIIHAWDDALLMAPSGIGNDISNNYFDDSTPDGNGNQSAAIYMLNDLSTGDLDAMVNNSIIHNTIVGCATHPTGGDGIRFVGSNRGNIVKDNEVSGCSKGYQIITASTSDAHFTGNKSHNNTEEGFVFQANQPDRPITGLVVRDNAAWDNGGGTGIGFHFYSNGHLDAVFEGNHAYNTGSSTPNQNRSVYVSNESGKYEVIREWNNLLENTTPYTTAGAGGSSIIYASAAYNTLTSAQTNNTFDVIPASGSYFRIKSYLGGVDTTYSAGEGSSLAVYKPASGSTYPFSIYGSADATSLVFRVFSGGGFLSSASSTVVGDFTSAGTVTASKVFASSKLNDTLDISPASGSYARVLNYLGGVDATYSAGEGSAFAAYMPASGATYPFTVYNSADSSAVAMRILSTGKVGIATTTPDMALSVGGNIRLQNKLIGYDTNNVLDIQPGGGSYLRHLNTFGQILTTYDAGEGSALAVYQSASGTTNPFSIYKSADSSSLALRVLSTGNVGIATSTPGSALSIQGNQFIAGNITSTSTTANIFPYASSTALSATFLCLGTDCRTVWPSAAGTGAATTSFTATWPATLSTTASTINYGFNGLSTSSPIAAGAALLYATGANTIASVATSTGTLSSPLTGNFLCVGSGCTLGIQAASASQAGSMAAGDYQRLYTATTTFTSPLIYTGSSNTVSCQAATASVPGCLAAADFSTFNGKANAFAPYFTWATNNTFNTTTAATTTSIWTQGVFFSSSTVAASQFPYASTTGISSNESAYFALNSGKVGIATTTPDQTLSVGGNIRLLNKLIGYDTNNVLDIQPGGGSYVRILNGANVAATFDAGEGSGLAAYGVSGSTYPFSIYTSADSTTLGMRLRSNGGLEIGTVSGAVSSPPAKGLIIDGKLGVATTSPGTALGVQGNSFFAGRIDSTSTISSTNLTVNLGTSQVAQLNDNSSASGFWGTSIGFLSQSGLAEITTNGQALTFNVSGTRNTMTVGTEVGRFSLTGNFGVGTTSPFALLSIHAASTTNNQYIFAIGTSTSYGTQNAFLIDKNGSTTIALFGACSGANALQTSAAGLIQCGAVSSDVRLKRDIKPIDIALSKLMRLTPVTFHWKEASRGAAEEDGFLAQDVQKLFPDAVETMQPTPLTPDGTLEIKEPNLVAYAIRAIQEQQEEIKNIRVGNITTRSFEDNWQWGVILLLVGYVAYNEYDKRR
jgi:hypothetical protein